MEYMPTLTPLTPPQLIGMYGSPIERLGMLKSWELVKAAFFSACGTLMDPVFG